MENQGKGEQLVKMNVLHREAGAESAGGPDREKAAGEESANGKLTGAAEPSDQKADKKGAGALSGTDEGSTWENKSALQKEVDPKDTPEGQKDQQTR